MSEKERLEEEVARAAALLARRRRCVALTGAGISVPSGIPDFRSKGGLWERFEPETYATAAAWRRDPAMVWEMFAEAGRMLAAARPNEAHRALARLERAGVVEAVITQNIDGLHRLAGSRRVVEFHGSGREIVCTGCPRRMPAEEVAHVPGEVPRCPSCGAPVRPDVVLFGEPIPRGALAEALDLASSCASMLVVGTSGIVAPASLLPAEAAAAGAAVVEVNLAGTAISRIAGVSIRGTAEEVLPLLAARVEEAGGMM